jgi:hypothetical protein
LLDWIASTVRRGLRYRKMEEAAARKERKGDGREGGRDDTIFEL